MDKRTDRAILKTLEESLARIETTLLLLLMQNNAKQAEQIDGAKAAVPKPANQKADIKKLTKGRRLTLPLPPATAKSLIGAVRDMTLDEIVTIFIPPEVDPDVMEQSAIHVTDTYEGRRFLITRLSNQLVIKRSA
jgi:hypothetical protein